MAFSFHLRRQIGANDFKIKVYCTGKFNFTLFLKNQIFYIKLQFIFCTNYIYIIINIIIFNYKYYKIIKL